MAHYKNAEHSVNEQWFERDDSRRFSPFFRQMILTLLFPLLTLGVVLMAVFNETVTKSEQLEDRQLAEALAGVPVEKQAEIAASAGREVLIVHEGEVRYLVLEKLPDVDEARWLRVVGEQAFRRGEGFFSTIDPHREEWWHTAASLSEGGMLILQRKKSAALWLVNTVTVWAVFLGCLTAGGMAVLWWFLRKRVEESTEVLLESTEDLRLRGEMRPVVRQKLATLPPRPLEFVRIGRGLQEIEATTRRAFDQVSSLLGAAEALGGSLDLEVVLSQVLEQLEHLLGATRCCVLSHDRQLGTFVVLASRGHNEAYLKSVTQRNADPAFPSVRALKERVPIQVPDTESEVVSETLRLRARQFGYRSVLAVPLPQINESSTVLILHKEEPGVYSHDEIQLSVSFSGVAAAALANAELFAHTDDNLRQLTSRLAAIMGSVDHGIMVESTDKAVIYANGVMCELMDADSSFVEGMSVDSFLKSVFKRAKDPQEASRVIDSLTPEPGHWGEVQICHDREVEQTFRVRMFTVNDDQGRILGQGQIWTDATIDHDLDQMKAGLLAAVSHEFRTPLALIKGYATTLLANDVEWSEEEKREFLGLVSSETDRLTNLVQRLLDMRRIDAGMVELQLLPVEAEALVAEVVSGLPHLAERIQVLPVPPLEVAVDSTRMVTALHNLVENACRYSPSSTLVTLSLVEREGAVEFVVADRGKGISDALKLRVFDTFMRADSGLDAETTGVGLGLSIAKGFIEAHGGRLWVEDGPQGLGSIFRVRLPPSLLVKKMVVSSEGVGDE